MLNRRKMYLLRACRAIMVKPLIVLCVLLIQVCLLVANDGAFYAQGDHLIPLQEAEISLQKEILEVKKVGNVIHVSVYYEFFNPSESKEVLVGFEASSPSYARSSPKNGKHPYISDFTVNVNDSILPYNVSYVDSKLYKKYGLKYTKSLKKILRDYKNGIESDDYPSFDYVYHFNAQFKKGLNIVKHSYKYSTSFVNMYYYYFPYVLSTCKRWANKKIDDFTLILNMGEMEDFLIEKGFFEAEKEWELNGVGKFALKRIREYEDGPFSKVLSVAIKKGQLIFHKKDFVPSKELYVYSIIRNIYQDSFDRKRSLLSYAINKTECVHEPIDDKSKKILRNLPFARRGMIFKDKDLQKYYTKKVDWYMPDSTYKGELNTLTREEIKWVEKYK